jgi:hypothetical protein
MIKSLALDPVVPVREQWSPFRVEWNCLLISSWVFFFFRMMFCCALDIAGTAQERRIQPKPVLAGGLSLRTAAKHTTKAVKSIYFKKKKNTMKEKSDYRMRTSQEGGKGLYARD